MRYKSKHKGSLKAVEIYQAEQILFRFFQNESFPNASKSIKSRKEISKTIHINQLAPFIDEGKTLQVKCRLMHLNSDYNAKHPLLLTTKHPTIQIYWRERIVTTYTKAKSTYKNAPVRVPDHRIKKCVKENQVEMCQMQTNEGQSNSSTFGRSNPRNI